MTDRRNLKLWLCCLSFFAASLNVIMIDQFVCKIQPETRKARYTNNRLIFDSKNIMRFKNEPRTLEHQITVNNTYKINPELVPRMIKLVQERYNFMKRYSRFYQPIEQKLPEQTRGVIILTQFRSGSSFLGELFNQHHDVFYTFEPLKIFSSYRGDNTHAEDKVEVLDRILKCDFPDFASLYKTYDFYDHELSEQCIKDNFCFRERLRNLCPRELCPRYGACHACGGPFHLPRMNQMCRGKKISAIKVIRLYNIRWLKSLLEDPSYDLKVIHLVRDPRGVQSSRLKIHPEMDVTVNATVMCDHHWINGNAPVSENTEWLSGKYLRIRYEDLASEPVKYSSEIYRFVGLHLTLPVKNWITKNTQSKNPSNSKWATSRNSSETMQSWRQHLSFDTVAQIQKICGKVMKLYGYKPVSSVEELRDLDNQLTI